MSELLQHITLPIITLLFLAINSTSLLADEPKNNSKSKHKYRIGADG
jgi:hypothetical protein